MEKFHPGNVLYFEAEEQISAGNLVCLSGDNKVKKVSSGSEAKFIGVALIDANAGEKVSVATRGVYELTADSDVSAGDKVKAVDHESIAPWDPASESADLIMGVALNGATAGGNVLVLIK
mgnify:CR=1 FL=1